MSPDSTAGYRTINLFGNPAVFPLRGDPWLCDPASQRVCRFGRTVLVCEYPITASPIGDNWRHNNPGQQRASLLKRRKFSELRPA
jgi:hypothetical protein